MPLQTTDFVEYKIVKISFDLTLGIIDIDVAKGVTSNGVFEILGSIQTIHVPQTDSATLFTLMGTTGVPVYGTIKASLYQYLLDHAWVTGTLV